MWDDLSEEGTDAFLLHEEAVTVRKGYQELKIYRLARELGVTIHHLSMTLTKYELYEMGSQLRRAAKSASANIVEGYGRRRYKGDFVRFLIYAKASLDETEEHLRYIRDCHAEQVGSDELLERAAELGRRLHRFIVTVEESHRT